MSKPTDFIFSNYGSVVGLRAVSEAAIAFATENFIDVEGWMGGPTNFQTDWRAGTELANRLVEEGCGVMNKYFTRESVIKFDPDGRDCAFVIYNGAGVSETYSIWYVPGTIVDTEAWGWCSRWSREDVR